MILMLFMFLIMLVPGMIIYTIFTYNKYKKTDPNNIVELKNRRREFVSARNTLITVIVAQGVLLLIISASLSHM